MLPRTGTRTAFDDKLRDCSKACKLCSLLSRRIKTFTSQVRAKRATADPIEPPAPVTSRVFPEMHSSNGKEEVEGRRHELPANSVHMLSSACALYTIAVTPDYKRDRADGLRTAGLRRGGQEKSRCSDPAHPEFC